jgi:hypothetical protein
MARRSEEEATQTAMAMSNEERSNSSSNGKEK